MTTPSAPDPQIALHGPVATTRRDHLAIRVLRSPVAAIASAFLLLAVLTAIFAPLLAPYDPNQADISNVLAPPGTEGHVLGTDGAGRDVLSRLIYAAQFSLAGAAVALAVSLVLGVVGGLLAAYFGGLIDVISGWIIALLMALPGIIVLLAARAVIGPSLWWSMVIFGVILSPSFFRLVYASVSAVKNELYVDAARVAGLSDARIISRHILTVVRAPIIIQAAIVGGIGLAIQSGLEFLGLGDLRVPTWGSMLADAFSNLYRAPYLVIWPATAIALTLLSLTLLANALRDELERVGGRRRVPRARRAAAAAQSGHATDASDVIRHGSPVSPDDALIRIDNLSVGYGQPDGSVKLVVEDVSLSVARGEVHGLVGESGSGKTQTAWSVLGLLPEGGKVVGGSIVFDGIDLVSASSSEKSALRGRRIAYIPQEPISNLDPSFTVGSQLTEPMRIKLGLSKSKAKSRALELLAKVGIPDPQRTFDAYPHQISGGMAQRVLIAGAISCEPDLLIADEPTTALDVTVQADVLDVLRGLQAELHMAVILVTHNFGVVADICDRVSVMKSGRIVETGPALDIFDNPIHPYTRDLLGSILTEAEPRGPLVASSSSVEGAS